VLFIQELLVIGIGYVASDKGKAFSSSKRSGLLLEGTNIGLCWSREWKN
jgi:hypothetical protein